MKLIGHEEEEIRRRKKHVVRRFGEACGTEVIVLTSLRIRKLCLYGEKEIKKTYKS